MKQISKRREKNIIRRKIKGILVVFFLTIIFILWTIYSILQSDLLNLKKIEVFGNVLLTEDEIIEESKLYLSRNIFQYNLLEIGDNVAKNPFVKDAEVKRKLPNSMMITVKEREKYAIIPYMGSFIYIDSSQVVLQASNEYLGEDLVLITGVEFQGFKLGDKIDINNSQLFDTALQLIEASRISSIIEMISEINIGNKDYIQLITFDGIEVLLAADTDPAYSILALKEILNNLYTRNTKDLIIDMRYKGQTFVGNRKRWEEN